MKKIKLLFDTQQLETFGTGKETGLFRFTSEIFKRLIEKDDIDLYCYLDKKHKNALEYLKLHYPEYQKQLVYLPNLSKTARDRNVLIRLKSLFYNLRLSKKYSRILKEFDWYFSPFNPVSAIVNKNLRSSIFIHDLIPIVCKEITCPKFTKSYEKFIQNTKCDFIFFNSENTKKDFLKYRSDYNEKHTAVLYLAADAKFHPANNKKIINSIKSKFSIKTEKYFLSVSDLNPRKNILFTVNGFIDFLKKSQASDISLVLAGPNKRWNKEVLSSIEDFQKYQDKIIFTGFVDDCDLPSLYSGAFAFIYTSLYEGFGLPPLEAMQSGVPVITSDISSLPEVVGDAGILINPTNKEDLLKNMTHLYQNEELRSSLIEKSLKRSKLFSWEKLVKDLSSTWQNN